VNVLCWLALPLALAWGTVACAQSEPSPGSGPYEHGKIGVEVDAEKPGDHVRLVTELPFQRGSWWSIGTGSSLGIETIGDETMSDITIVLSALGLLGTLITYPWWSQDEGGFPPWALWPIHIAQLPAAHLDLSVGDRVQWSVGVGLHGRLVSTNAFFRKDEGPSERGLLFAPGPRLALTARSVRLLLHYGQRHWLREHQRWSDDSSELTLRLDVSTSLWD
jgi:hypothetical protein